MSYFLNNNFRNNEFELISKDKYFVDKTDMISEINDLIGTKDRFICITRPRRFGKIVNAMMLASYYCKNVNFKYLFDKLEISNSLSYLEHLNKHNVIYMALNEMPKTRYTYQEFIENYIEDLIDDIVKANPDIKIDREKPLYKIFMQIYNENQKGFIFIIDEWDYIFNNNLFSQEDRENFLQFLKDKPYVELAYMTGVLPIAKYSSGSSLNMFVEYTFLNDTDFDKYFGFTNFEVEKLCSKQNKLSMNELKDWYNGYKTQGNHEIYNPRSVVLALKRGVCQSYWTNTGPMN